MTRERDPYATRPDDCPTYAGGCIVHGFTHGAEAEELREGIEKIIARAQAYGRRVQASVLQELLDHVDARDSVAFRERRSDSAIPEGEKR